MGRSAKLRAEPKAGRGASARGGKGKAGSGKRPARVAPVSVDPRNAGGSDGGARAGSGAVGCVAQAEPEHIEAVAPAGHPADLKPGWADSLGSQLAAEERSVIVRQYKRTPEQRFKMAMSQRARWAARKGQCSG